MLDIEKCLNVTFTAGQAAGDQSTTTAVKTIDMSSWFAAGEKAIFVQAICTVELYYALRDAESPTPASTITAVTGNGVMDRAPADAVVPLVVLASAPWLHYSADSGILRVRRASPPPGLFPSPR